MADPDSEKINEIPLLTDIPSYCLLVRSGIGPTAESDHGVSNGYLIRSKASVKMDTADEKQRRRPQIERLLLQCLDHCHCSQCL